MRTDSSAAGQSAYGPGVFVALLIFIVAALAGCAAGTSQIEQGPPVVRSLTIYEELVRRSKRLVECGISSPIDQRPTNK